MPLVTTYDLAAVGRMATSPAVRRRLLRRLAPAQDRVRATWDGTEATPLEPHRVEGLRRRTRQRVTGDPDTDVTPWLAERFLPDRAGLHGLSVGSGMGAKERRWAQTGRFATLRGLDLSPERVAHANGAAAEHGLGDVLTFTTADVWTLDPAEPIDVLIGDSSLHHFTEVEALVAKLARWLAPDGVVVVNEFVGPRRFQWTAGQRSAARELLGTLPPRLRTRVDGRVVTGPPRPGTLRMRLEDPSEAVESDRVLPALDAVLRREWLVDVGGLVNNLVLPGIAHHFADPGDDEAQAHLERLLDREDQLLAAGVGTGINVVAVYRSSHEAVA